jgi:hypothetical protein
MRPNFLHEPLETYLAQSRQFMTAHQLRTFARCPLLYRQQLAGLVPGIVPDFYTLGAAIHCLIVEGQQAFDRDYIVGGPINPKTEKPYGDGTKAFREWAAGQTKRVISDEQYALACQLSHSVHSHPTAAETLADPDGVAEGVLRAAYGGVACQVRVDWFSPGRGIVDLKTCDDIDHFEQAIATFGYVEQMAFYQAVLEIETGQNWPATLIAVEKKPPYRCGLWELSQAALDASRRENAQFLNEFLECQSTNKWPTRYEATRTYHRNSRSYDIGY